MHAIVLKGLINEDDFENDGDNDDLCSYSVNFPQSSAQYSTAKC